MKRTFYTFLFCGILGSSFFALNFASADEPEAPQLLLPADGSTVSATPYFDWSSVPGATSYTLSVGNESWPLSNSEYQIQSSEALTPDDYQWGVMVCNADGCNYSETRNFTVAGSSGSSAAPPAPTGLSPCNESGISTTPTLSWSNAGTYSYNKVHLGGFTPITTFGSSITIDPIELGFELQSGQSYTWYVEACSQTNQCSQSSNSCSFTTKSSSSGTPGGTPGGTPDKTTRSGGNWVEIKNPLKYQEFDQLLNAILHNFFYFFAPSIAVVMFVIAGFMFVISAGDPVRLKKARDLALWTAIGLAIILLASGLIKVLQSIIGVKETTLMLLNYFT